MVALGSTVLQVGTNREARAEGKGVWPNRGPADLGVSRPGVHWVLGAAGGEEEAEAAGASPVGLSGEAEALEE